MSKNNNSSAAATNINPRPIGATKKFKVSYFDKNGNFRFHFATSNNERDALVDSWLNNKHIVEPVSAEPV